MIIIALPILIQERVEHYIQEKKITGPGFWWGRVTIPLSDITNNEYTQRSKINKFLFRYPIRTIDGKAVYIDENLYKADLVQKILSSKLADY